MKTSSIIRKNIKLLLRSKIATLVLIFGPLLIIMLVGVSFNTDSFNLNIGIYSEAFSDESRELVAKLENESFTLREFQTEESCIEDVKLGNAHACLVFAKDMQISNPETNTITFHVDQSKVNIVYFVMASIRESVGERSVDISKDLTDAIVTTLFSNKQNIESTIPLITDINTLSSDVKSQSTSAKGSLGGLNLQTGNFNANTQFTSIETEMKNLIEDTIDHVETSSQIVNDDLESYTNDIENNLSSAYQNDLTALLDELELINSSVREKNATTLNKISTAVSDINNAFDDFSSKLQNADSVKSSVVQNLNQIEQKNTELENKAKQIQQTMNTVISNINTIQITNTDQIVQPIKTEIEKIAKEEDNLGFLFPSLIIILVMFLGLLLASSLIIMEKKSRAFFRVFTTPTAPWLFDLGTYLTSLILITFQLLIILTVSHFYFEIDILSSFSVVVVSLVMITTLFVLLGMFIGYIFPTQELAMLASISISTLLLLTSGIVFPLESMPKYISEINVYNPVVLGADVFRKALLFGWELFAFEDQFSTLLAFSIIIIIGIFIVKRVEHVGELLKNPGKKRRRKQEVTKLFVFGERHAKTLPEFLVSLQTLSEEQFEKCLERHAIRDWLLLVFKNTVLANKVGGLNNKEEIVAILSEEIEKIQKP